MQNYSIVRLVNQGGQGLVYEVIGNDWVTYALKVLNIAPDSPDPDEDRRRFEREISLMTMLNHPGIVKVSAAAGANGEPAYIMPWASHSLQQELAKNPWGLEEGHALEIFDGVLDAIEYAHAANVLHRDLKPGNVLFIEGRYQVSDFGYSRRMNSDSAVLTRTNAGFGSEGYVAPEQWQNAKDADVTADVYSLGAVLYRLLANASPAAGIDPARVPERFRDVVVRATSRDSKSRYLSIAEMKKAIARRRTDIGETEAVEKKAARLLTEWKQQRPSALAELTALLLANRDNTELYLNFVTTLPGDWMQAMAKASVSTLTDVLGAYLTAIEGQHPWLSTDRYALFIERAWNWVESAEVRLMLLRPLLLLGYNHNRYFVRDLFVRIGGQAANDVRYVHSLIDVLDANPGARRFVRDAMLATSLPPAVEQILRQDG